MTTTLQLDANRRNFTLSTGPRSEAGKTIVSRNAISHGFSSASPVLSYEDQTAFEKSIATLSAEFKPQGEHEKFLIQEMAEARWRLARIRRIEAACFNSLLGDAGSESPDGRIAEALLNKGGDVLSKLLRYASAAERSYYKAHKELLASSKARQQQHQAAQPKQLSNNALLDLLMRPPVCKTKPIANAPYPEIDVTDDDELEFLTRPVVAGAA